MITDVEMIALGFKKEKAYREKTYIQKAGVSSFVWANGRFELNIEKDFGADFGDFFQPTLRINQCIWRYEEIDKLKVLLRALSVIN